MLEAAALPCNSSWVAEALETEQACFVSYTLVLVEKCVGNYICSVDTAPEEGAANYQVQFVCLETLRGFQKFQQWDKQRCDTPLFQILIKCRRNYMTE